MKKELKKMMLPDFFIRSIGAVAIVSAVSGLTRKIKGHDGFQFSIFNRCSKLLLIFLIAICLRIGLALKMPEGVAWIDGERYERIAINLIEGRGFGTLEEIRLAFPTQPILISIVYFFFGKNYTALRIFFAMIGSSACLMGYILARNLFGRFEALAAGLLLAIYPQFIFLSALFEYPQMFFIFLMSIFFVLFFKFRELERKMILFFAGIVLGVAALSVPTVLMYVPFFLLLLVTRSLRESLKRIGLVSLALAIPIGSWSLRNYAVYDRFILINLSAGTNFWSANNQTYLDLGKPAVVPPCAKGYEETDYCLQIRNLWRELDRSSLSEEEKIFEEEKRSWANGIDFIKNNPIRYLGLIIKKFLSFWSPFPDAVSKYEEHSRRFRDIISVTSYVPVLILGLLGICLSIRANPRNLAAIYLFFFVFTGAYCIFLPTMRYRLPLDFLLIIFATVPLHRIYRFLFLHRT